MLSRLKTWLKKNGNIFLLIFGLTFILYANSLPNKMFWDDQDNILFNEFVHSWKHFPKYFTENNVAGRGLVSNYWRPLPLTIWSIEWDIWENWAPGYHLVQLLLHATAGFLVFLLLLKLFNRRILSLLVAALFIAHPLQTEAITYVSGISDPLSGIFIPLTLLFFLKYKEAKGQREKTFHYLSSLGSMALLLMARETGIFVVAALGLVAITKKLKKGYQNFPSFIWSLTKDLWPYITLALVYVFLRATVLNFQNTFNLYNETNEFTGSYLTRVLTFFRIITIYAQLLFWPFNLHMERSVELAKSVSEPDVLIGAGIVLASLLLLSWALIRRQTTLFFGLGWILIWIFPTSNILVPINGLLFEHWLYIPMIGLWLIILSPLLRFAKTNKIKALALTLCYFTFISFLGIRTIQRNAEWRDPITFYNQTLQYAPESYRVINNLGMAYADEGRHEEAEKTYLKAIEIAPNNAVAYHNLGNTYKAVGRRDEAIDNFNKAIALDNRFFFSYNALADLFVREQNLGEARKVLERLLGVTSDKIDVLIPLAQLAYQEKDIDGAIKYLEQAVALDPTNLQLQQTLRELKFSK